VSDNPTLPDSDTPAVDAPASITAGLESPGKLLAAGRRARELTLDEVADALNLSPQAVEWLETDNFSSLPAAAFTQGYIRNYAKYVGLDADGVVAAYQGKAGKPDVAWESPRGNVGLAELVQRHPGMLISIVVAAVVLLIVIVLLVVWPDDETETSADPEIGLEVAPNRASANTPTQAADRPLQVPADRPDAAANNSAPAIDSAAANQSGAISSRPNSSGPASSTNRFDDPNAAIDRTAIDPEDPLAHLPVAKTYPVISEASAPATRPAPRTLPTPAIAPTNGSGNTISRRLTPGGSSQVRLVVAEDCWISIKNTAGKELYAALGREGQTYNLTGKGPFSVLLGYAPGALLYLDDRQIPLEPYTRNNIARLVIGQ